MKILEFRKISIDDIYDDTYNDGCSWSRLYEYPLAIDRIKKYYKEGHKIHNTSWGFAGLHILFKENLDKLFNQVYHSDILESTLKNTFIYDITKPPAKEEIGKYDILLNVSTLEEVRFNHLKVFDNLLLQLKKGGILIATFDLNKSNSFITSFRLKRRRVLQIKKFEKKFSKKIEVKGIPISGETSRVKNLKYNHLNCGIMVIKK